MERYFQTIDILSSLGISVIFLLRNLKIIFLVELGGYKLNKSTNLLINTYWNNSRF